MEGFIILILFTFLLIILAGTISKSKRRRTRNIWKNSSGGSVFGVDKRTRAGKMAWLNPGRTEGRKRHGRI